MFISEVMCTAMTIPEIISAITTVGFPIVMCGAMAWFVKYITDKNREQIDEMNEKHKTEMNDIVTAINNNTLALQKLCERMENE